MTITCAHAEVLDTSYDAINKFLRECSPVELLEDTDLFELTSDTASSTNNDQTDDTEAYHLNEHDNDFLQSCTKANSAKLYRSSRKQELETLREKISSLKAQFQSLELKRMQNARNCTAGRITSSRTQKLWQQVALSQLDRRRRSEIENSSLREMVRIQMLEAKNLRRILKRRSRIESMQEAFGVKGVKQLLKNTSTDKEHFFQTLLHEADQIFVGMDDLFMKKGVDNMPYTGHVRTANLEIIDGVYYEILQKRLLPFDMQATEKAVWECLRRLALDNLRGVGGSNALVNVHPNCTKEDGDTLQSSFFAVISGIEDLTGTYNLKVARRYKGSDRTTFVCRIISEPKFESRKQGVSATTTMQIMLSKVNTGDKDDGTTTMMKVYFSAERTALTSKEDSSTRMAFAAWDKLVPRFPVDVESVLLDAYCSLESNVV